MKHQKFRAIRQFEPKKQTAKEILEQFAGISFQARQLGRAYEVCRDMISDKDCSVILTLSGALVPAGLRLCVTEMIKNGWVKAIVSTGANLTHDLANAFGEEYLYWSGKEKDSELRKKKSSRIYDVISPDSSSIKFEKDIQKILAGISGEHTPSSLLKEIGNHISDKNSIVGSAAKNNIPIYCPALSDSILGFQIWMYQQDHRLKVNEMKDLQKIFDWMYELRAAKKKTGVIILGGGVPKNYAIQAALLPEKPHDYLVQITTDNPVFGGLSGASLEEGISWGKVKPEARLASVVCDCTIAFPLIVSALKEELG